jgi:YVTN family beta-propeller protein
LFVSTKIKRKIKKKLNLLCVLTMWIIRAATLLSSLIIVMLLVLSHSSYFSPNNNVIAQNNGNTEGSKSENRIKVEPLKSGIDVDTFPTGIAVNPNTSKVYVANEYSNTVSVLGTESDKVQNRINVGIFPYSIDINPLNNRVYVTNRGSNTVSVIDGSIDTKLLDITVGKSPVGVAVNPSANWIYITNLDDGTMSVIDGISNEVINTIQAGRIPYAVTVNPLSNRIYAADIGSNTVSVIDGETNRIVTTIPVGEKPTGLAIDITTEGNNRLYVANYDSDSISVVDMTTNKVIDNITSGGDSPVGIATNPKTGKLYVSNIVSNTVSVINTKAIDTLGKVDGNKNSIVVSKLTSAPAMTSFKKDNDKDIILKEISVNPTLKTSYNSEDSLVSLPSNVGFPLLASQVTIDPYENIIYMTNTASNTISIINGNSDQVAVRLTFNVNPPNTGEVQCNGVKNISRNSTLYDRGQMLQCIAIPERGYTFASWSDLVSDLTTNPITLEASRFGTLTANFKPAVTLEVYIFIIGGIVGAASVFVGWYYKYGQRRYVNRYLTRIESTYDTLHDKDKQQCILQLQRIRTELLYLFKKGALSDSHYNILDKKVSDYIDAARYEEKK